MCSDAIPKLFYYLVCPNLQSSPLADKSSSLPSTSQELADIFGASDEEQDMDFPFSLNMGKAFTDLSLPGSREADFFLNSLNSLDSIPVSSNSNLPLEQERDRITAADEEAVAGKVEENTDLVTSRCDVHADTMGNTIEDKAADDDGNKEQDQNESDPVASVPGKKKGLKCKNLLELRRNFGITSSICNYQVLTLLPFVWYHFQTPSI